MKMIVVEVRPGITIRVTEAEAKRRGWKPYSPKQSKKAAPAASKKAGKAATPQEETDGIRND
jgi:hypothetical protein